MSYQQHSITEKVTPSLTHFDDPTLNKAALQFATASDTIAFVGRKDVVLNLIAAIAELWENLQAEETSPDAMNRVLNAEGVS